MPTKIKNYTSIVSPDKSIAAIEKMLREAGASYVGKNYDNGEVVGFTFTLIVEGQPKTFKLPCNVPVVFDVLKPAGWMSEKKIRALHEQAKRTAWRLLSDWVAVQLSMIKLRQAEAVQIFLPYIYDTLADKTFFEYMRETGYKLLGAPKPVDPEEPE